MRNRVLITVLVIAVAFFAGYRMLPASGEGLRMSPEAEIAITEMGGEATLSAENIASG